MSATPDDREIWYVDTGVFVTPLLKNRDAVVIEACDTWLARMTSGEILGCTSMLTWDEVTYVAGRAKGGYDPAAAARAGDLLRAWPNLDLVAVDDRVLFDAQRLLEITRFRPRDCLHAATARLRADGRIATLDRDFSRPGAPPVGLRIRNVGA